MLKIKILVTGGAGYIGSVVVKRLCEQNHDVIVIDNLKKGKQELIHKNAKLIKIDLKDDIEPIFQNNNFDAVFHFAAAKDAGESMKNMTPYSENITNFIKILGLMTKYSVKKIIFSSSAAVYGNPNGNLIDESHPLEPINYYGFSKLECERILKWYSDLKGIIGISLRYFNVAGDELGYLDPNAKNVFPIIGEVIQGKRDSFQIFGDDYETKDGTCIRDYIHVSYLADAHVLALNQNETDVFNLGSGKGYSVKELLASFNNPPSIVVSRREGDPPSLVCSYDKSKEILSWEPKKTLKDMVESTIKLYK